MGHSNVRWRLTARIDNDARSAFSIDVATPKQPDWLRGKRVIQAVVAASTPCQRHQTGTRRVICLPNDKRCRHCSAESIRTYNCKVQEAFDVEIKNAMCHGGSNPKTKRCYSALASSLKDTSKANLPIIQNPAAPMCPRSPNVVRGDTNIYTS
jgi:hypothetical protein